MGKRSSSKPPADAIRQNVVSVLAIGFATFCPLYVLALWVVAPFTVMNCLPLQDPHRDPAAYIFLPFSSFLCAGACGITVSLLLCWRMMKGRILLRRCHRTVLGLLLVCLGITTADWLLGLLLLDHLRVEGIPALAFAVYWTTLAPVLAAWLSIRTLRFIDSGLPALPEK